MLKARTIIFSLIFIAFIFTFAYKADGKSDNIFCLNKSYEYYKKNFMSKDGRILDPDKNNITTSEGQSYIMMRSVIMRDRKTFDLTYKWSKNNLQRKDKLFAWLWGKNAEGKYKILDYNSASDADVDIALALLVAYETWNDDKYLKDAKAIINSIWNNETRRIGSRIVLMPGVVQNTDIVMVVNPSYFSPYSFRFFQKYDEKHDWNYLIDSSYYYLNQVMAKTDTKLPPNWFIILDGKIILDSSKSSDFSYDAIRVFFRVYLDYIRTGEKRALPILEKSKFFISKWKSSKKFYTNYKANGNLRDDVEYTGSIAILLPVINMYDPKVANEIYKEKLSQKFNDENYWKSKKDYYGKNLSWFGCYMQNKEANEHKRMHKMRIIGY